MFDAYVTVQDKKVYVAGGFSPVDDAHDQVYVYDVNTDHWVIVTSLRSLLWYSSHYWWQVSYYWRISVCY